MIFNCPDCGAGHSVPVSMIPNGGHDIACRRCGEPFVVEPPVPTAEMTAADDDEERFDNEDPTEAFSIPHDTEAVPVAFATETEPEPTLVGPSPLEATAAGMMNPIDDTGSRPLVAPGGREFTSIVDSDDVLVGGPQDHDRPTVPITTEEPVPLGPDEAGIDPELDDTVRFNTDARMRRRPKLPQVSPLDEPPPQVDLEAAAAASLREVSRVPSGSGASDVYERVAHGIRVPDEAGPTAERLPSGPRPERLQSPTDAGGPMQAALTTINRAPLALKVGLVVFPITLGIVLLFTAPAPTETVEIDPGAVALERIAEASPSVEAAEPPELPEADDAPEAPAQDPEPEPQGPQTDIAAWTERSPAPDGHAYLQRRAPLRLEARKEGAVTIRLSAGTLVRLRDVHENYVLVIREPYGPAGYVAMRNLGSERPASYFARVHPFKGCKVAKGGTKDDCLYAAKQSEDQCHQTCGKDAANPKSRCMEFCAAAFENCTRSCAQRRRSKLTRRRRR